MNDLYKYTSPKWNEVMTEHEQKFRSCSGISRIIEKRKKRIDKYGYPKRCPAINKMQSLIFFKL